MGAQCSLSDELLIAGEQEGDPLGLGLEALNAVSCVHGAVELLMGLEQNGRHGERIVEIGQGGGGKLGADVEHGLGCSLDGGAVFFCRLGPGKVVVDDGGGVLVIAFHPTADGPHPGHVHGGLQDAEMVGSGIWDDQHAAAGDKILGERTDWDETSSF